MKLEYFGTIAKTFFEKRTLIEIGYHFEMPNVNVLHQVIYNIFTMATSFSNGNICQLKRRYTPILNWYFKCHQRYIQPLTLSERGDYSSKHRQRMERHIIVLHGVASNATRRLR